MFPEIEPYIAGAQNQADCSHHDVFELVVWLYRQDENNEPVVLKSVRQHNVRNYVAVLM